MYKIAILNVGGAFSAYAELNDKKVVIDLGSGNEFSPVNDFLLPLINKGKFIKSQHNPEKYHLDQLFLSHLDNDHVSDYIEFRKYFQPGFMTCPNRNPKQNDEFKINDELIGDIEDSKQLVLDDMDTRGPNSPEHPEMSEDNPLISIVNEIDLYYIKPSECESDVTLKTNYANNISLILFIKLGSKNIFIPGDISKEGMQYLIDRNPGLKKELTDLGVDYYITPHHGLQTSFSEYFFQTINGKKTRLNIISEKVRTEDSNENRSDVDSRYYGEEYSSGENDLKQRGVKTSMGHIVIDFTTDDAIITQYQDIKDVIKEFIV
jgi:beta-lactamase superfamily II metal-dependent hydrolase